MPLSSRAKRLLLIAGFVLLIFIFAFALYWVFFRSAKPPVAEPTININGQLIPISQLPNVNFGTPRNFNVNAGVLPEVSLVAQGGKTSSEIIVPESSESSFLGSDGILKYYDKETGIFYRVGADGTLTSLTDAVFRDAENIIWSPDANKVVLEFPDGSNVSYDFENRKQYTLPKDSTEFSFAPDTNQIAFKYVPERASERWLGISKYDGSEVQGIEPLGKNGDKVQVQWSPSGVAIATFNEYVNGTEQRVFPLGIHGENFKQMFVNGRDFEYKWTPSGKQMAYNVYNAQSNYKPELFIVDALGDDIGKNRKDTGLQTWVEKCTYNRSGTNLYCAVPQSLPEGAGIEPNIASTTPDDIYKIDLQTGTKTKIAEPTDASGIINYTISSLMVSADEKYAYFTDKNDQSIHSLRLK